MAALIRYILFIVIITAHSQTANAQFLINGLGQSNAYAQNFNSLSSTTNTDWGNNITLPHWYAARSNGNQTLILRIATGTSNTGSLYNFGSAGNTDRALGAISSGSTGTYFYGVRLKNNMSTTVTAFNISFTGEQWRNSKAGAQALTFSYAISSNAITSVAANAASWVELPALNFTSPITGGTAGALNGNQTANRKGITYTLTGISLPPNSEIMFRWTDINHRSNDHGLAIDDVEITPLTPNQYYSKANGNLNDLSTWGQNLDGSGTQPLNFSAPSQIFNIRNSATKTISANWTISGFGSKAILNNLGNPVFLTIPANFVMQGNLDVMANATLNIFSPNAPALGLVAPTSTVQYSNGNQTIMGITYGNLTIAGGGTKTLNGQVTVNGTLNFTLGTIELGNYNLQMLSNPITGFSATNYVKTSGLGALRRNIARGGSAFFPIGTAGSYNPVTIALTSGSADDNFFVSVLPALYSDIDEDSNPLGPAVTSHVVPRTWVIAEEMDGGSNATITLQWNGNEELANFNRTTSNIASYVNTNWVTSANGAASGSNPYARSLSGITAFNAFAVAGVNAVLNPVPLPVTLISFNAEAKNHHVVLSWLTSMEDKNDRFEVQRSGNAKNWEIIGSVKSKGNTSRTRSYSFTDHTLPEDALVYYRLQQFDADGSFTFSPIKTVAIKHQKHTAIFKNPFQNELRFTARTHDLMISEIRLFNALGKLVFSTQLPKHATPASISLPHLPAGLYTYQLLHNDQPTNSGKLIKHQ